MVLTKQHLIDSISNHCGLPKTKSPKAAELILEFIKSSLVSEEDVLISGFGKFCVKRKAERRGRNPATGKDITLASRTVVTFRCSPVLRGAINSRTS